jgi:WhiB family transcriptional regulator, redox-sensing transcriptional regulator
VEWSNQAACLSAVADREERLRLGGGALDDVAMAKAICGTCSVLTQCRDYALATRQPFGVWGGLDEDERRLHWSARPAAALAT